MPGPLATLLVPERITLTVQNTEHIAALSEVAHLLKGHPDVTDFRGFYDELLARERIDATCLGDQIAIPHARTEHVAGIVMAVGRSDRGVRFGNSDEEVRMMFVLGTPKSNASGYLQVVGALCRIIKDPANRRALLLAPTATDFLQVLSDLEARVLGPRPSPMPARP
jgi:mannitol/fructose-specific phosphotransferase system IIA component (Ntr-type)